MTTNNSLRWIGGVILVTIICMGITNALYWTAVIPHTLTYRSHEAYQETIRESTITNAYFGSSHTWMGAYPNETKEAYNFGGGTNTPEVWFYKYRQLIRDGEHPRAIFIENDLETYSQSFASAKPMLLDAWYYKKLATFHELAEATNESVPRVMFAAYIPFLGKGLQFFTAKQESTIYRGWLNTTFVWKAGVIPNELENTIKRHYTGGAILHPPSMAYYEQVIALAVEENATIILIRYPMLKAYALAAQTHVDNRSAYNAIVLEKTSAIADTYILLDYYDLFWEQPEYFADPHHINQQGAFILENLITHDMQAALKAKITREGCISVTLRASVCS